MPKSSQPKAKAKSTVVSKPTPRSRQMFPRFAIGAMVFLLVLPVLLNDLFQTTGLTWNGLFHPTPSELAPLFRPSVSYWGQDIVRWSQERSLDPNLLATVMQIESCGHPSVVSSAGAQGLFQVMPFHFDLGEVYTEPETNAKRGANYLKYCMDYSNQDVGLALACYNGGQSVVKRDRRTWASETQRYYIWGTGIYTDATQNLSDSPTLNMWLHSGGQYLCTQASMALGLVSN